MFPVPNEMHLPMILLAAFVASASPGPATLTIAGTAMNRGAGRALAVASGVTCGSLCWSIAAALGLGAVMLANVRAFEILRIAGGVYLAFLAFKSARAAFSREETVASGFVAASWAAAFRKGLALHLTNPKAILFFGALYSMGVPANVSWAHLALLVAAIGAQSALIFHGYALLFSLAVVRNGYRRMRRGFEAAFAVAFGAAAWKILSFR
jgi:threonine/homoserine/homoserine lactone efflux protein